MKARLISANAMNRTKTRPRPRERVAFAQRLRQARIAAGHVTMEAAARAIGIRSGVYWRHENGKQGITLEFVRLYARAFAVDPGWLAFGSR
jgi:DNA-binding XRE family transcriptional regulator